MQSISLFFVGLICLLQFCAAFLQLRIHLARVLMQRLVFRLKLTLLADQLLDLTQSRLKFLEARSFFVLRTVKLPLELLYPPAKLSQTLQLLVLFLFDRLRDLKSLLVVSFFGAQFGGPQLLALFVLAECLVSLFRHLGQLLE